MSIPTLEEMAQAIEEKRQQLATAEARAAELRVPYDAARGKVRAAAKELKAMTAAMAAAKRAYAIRRALDEKGIDYPDQPLIAVERRGWDRGHQYFVLVAVSTGGTGLYVYTPDRSHRYEGKVHAVRESIAGYDAEAERPHYRERTSDDMRAAGLVAWQERGRGDFGPRSGGFRPMAPPEGGRWRWLKIREQEELTA